MLADQGTLPTLLCCMCGVEIKQNPTNMCVACLREHVDITEGIPRQLTIHSCRSCQRFLGPPWMELQLESKELLSLCLRKVPGLKNIKLIDAVWIWTEPHSMRLKIKLTIQKEVINGAILQQAMVIEFIIRNQQCTSCQASYATGAWHAVVQIRQRVHHKRTFFFIEQLLLKHNAHSDCINMVSFRDGMDFYFVDKNQALRFIDFLESHIPMKTKYSRKLVSADHTNNTANFKHNYLCDVAPICKDDLIIIPKPLAKNLSDINTLLIVKHIAAGIHVVDPFTCERHEISSEKYWRWSFQATMNSKQLTRYVILSVEPILHSQRPSAKKRGADRKLRLAECVIARERDLGANDTQFTCITHLGHLLREGDIALGYDLTNATWVHDLEKNSIRQENMPDVILVRKHHPTKSERIWALKSLHVDEKQEADGRDGDLEDRDYEEFLQELESDRELRAQINLYKTPKAKVLAAMEVEDEEEIRLEELLDDLMISEGLKSSDADVNEVAILSPDEARSVVVNFAEVEPNPFDPSAYSASDFKFK